MKKIALTFGIFVLSIGMTFAQSNLKGPKAKNAKPWQIEKEATQVATMDVNKNDFKGPENKNFKVQDHDRVIINISTIQSNAHGKKGPAAKNHKPWMSEDNLKQESTVPEDVIAQND